PQLARSAVQWACQPPRLRSRILSSQRGNWSPATSTLTSAEQIGGVRILSSQHVGDVGDLLPNGLWIDAVGEVVGRLLGAAAVGLTDSSGHRVGDRVGIHVDLT